VQLALQSTAVKDVAVWAISNPSLAVAFERRAAGGLTLPALGTAFVCY